MPTLVLTDIHGNLPALEAVLAHPAAQKCDEIISLGDHVNFGPESRAVHDRLTELGAVMLLGNHEERLLRPADAEFDGYNWALMRWTAQQMAGVDLHLPTDLRRGNVLFTHGTPGEPYHLVQPWEISSLLDTLPDGVTLLLSGHNHTPWDVARDGRRWVNPGSTGMRELPPQRLPWSEIGHRPISDSDCSQSPSVPSMRSCTVARASAPFYVLEGETLTHHTARYDVDDVARAFLRTGAARVIPELTRAVLHVMRTAEPQGAMKLILHVRDVAAGMGLSLADEAAWKAADRTYPWPEDMTSDEYWSELEKSL